MNTFGTRFRISLFGESHGPAVGVVMDGVPPGIPVTADTFVSEMDKRKGGATGTTQRRESDNPVILSGVYKGFTTGAPVAIIFNNEDTREEDYKETVDHPRPSHADYTARVKYKGFNDPRGGGHFSGRLTAGIVCAGVVAKKIIGNAVFTTEIAEIGGFTDKTLFAGIVESAAKDGDSVGGIIECHVSGIPAGLGEPFFDSVESVISHILFSVPGVKGVEFGNGFQAPRIRGSQNNDPFIDKNGKTSTNNSGGINGGITNGNEIIVRVAIKPTSSISIPQNTFNFGTGRTEDLLIRGRHDTCIALRAPIVIESCVAIALAQLVP